MITYTTILHQARNKLGLTLNEYSIADIIYQLQNNPSSECVGWCYASKKMLGDCIGVTEQSVHSIIGKLIEKGLLEKNSETKYLRINKVWYETVVMMRNEMNRDTKETLASDTKESLVDDTKETLVNNNKYNNNKYNNKSLPKGNGAETAKNDEKDEEDFVNSDDGLDVNSLRDPSELKYIPIEDDVQHVGQDERLYPAKPKKKKVDPRVDAVVEHFKKVMNLKNLDGPANESRYYAYNFIRKMEKIFGKAEAFDSANKIISCASLIPYWKGRSTTIKVIYYNTLKIMRDVAEQMNSDRKVTPETKAMIWKFIYKLEGKQ